MPDPVAAPVASAAVSGALGAVAGIVAVTVANPLHVIKAIVMTRATTKGKPSAGVWHGVSTPLRDMGYAARRVLAGPMGVRGFFAGIKHAVLREMLPGTIMFASMPLFQAACVAWFGVA